MICAFFAVNLARTVKTRERCCLDQIFDDNVRQIISERGFDDWAVAVQGRMDAVVDLFAADAGCVSS